MIVQLAALLSLFGFQQRPREVMTKAVADFRAGRIEQSVPAEVGNAAWHFLCVARAESPEAARQQLLPVGPAARVPMREVYQMFLGRATPAPVLPPPSATPRSVATCMMSPVCI